MPLRQVDTSVISIWLIYIARYGFFNISSRGHSFIEFLLLDLSGEVNISLVHSAVYTQVCLLSLSNKKTSQNILPSSSTTFSMCLRRPHACPVKFWLVNKSWHLITEIDLSLRFRHYFRGTGDSQKYVCIHRQLFCCLETLNLSSLTRYM